MSDSSVKYHDTPAGRVPTIEGLKDMAEGILGKEVMFCRDETCPECGFPETTTVCDSRTMEPIRIECSGIGNSKRDCTYSKILERDYDAELKDKDL